MLRILLFIGLSYGQSHKRLPDAIIFGVRKGGTRALLEFVEINSKVSRFLDNLYLFKGFRSRSGNSFLRSRRQLQQWQLYMVPVSLLCFFRILNMDYREQMPEASDDQLVIEKTPRYFVVRKAILRMKVINSRKKWNNSFKELVNERKKDCDQKLSPSWTCKPLKLILIVREPVSRLISGFTQIQDKRLKLNKEPGI